MLSGGCAAARALAMILQTCHWQAAGDSFYGHHLLFERLYNDVLPEIDALGERAVGHSDEMSVDIKSQFDGMGAFLKKLIVNPGTVPSQDDLLEAALHAEETFLDWLRVSIEVLEKDGSLTPGVENLLGGIADKHEEHVYLLQQVLR
jgi:DNA-binding ferritin-like protein